MTFTVYAAGTFNVLTKGHEKLLKAAIDQMEGFRHLQVYVTRDQSKETACKAVPVRPYDWRAGDVRRFLKRCGLDDDQFRVDPMPDPLPAVDKTDTLVCTNEFDVMERAKRLTAYGTGCKLVIIRRVPGIPSSTQVIMKSLKREDIMEGHWDDLSKQKEAER